MATLAQVRPSPLAGTWYDANPAALSRSVEAYLNHAKLPQLNGEVIAVIAPHAGHIYSGPVAGYAFATVRKRSFDLVAVISPMHQYFSAPLITTAHAAYATPLGDVPVDHEAVNALSARLKAALGFGLSQVAYDHEHSLEIELPFLQTALSGSFKLLPVMVRAVEPKVSQALGAALAETLREHNALLVASTDLSHFKDQRTANTLDSEMLRCIETFSPEAVFDAEANEKGFACGLGALTAVMWAARVLGADSVKVLHHATSGDVTGDHSSVVGYGAAVIVRS